MTTFTPQRLEALQLANQTRQRRLELRRRVPANHRGSCRFVASLLRDMPPALNRMEIRDLLDWVVRPRPTRAEFTDALMSRLTTQVDKRVGELTERQRHHLAALLEAGVC